MEYEVRTRDQLVEENERLALRIAALEAELRDNADRGSTNYLLKETCDICGRPVSVSVDISNAESLRRELNEIRRRYRLILDAMPANISYVDTGQNLRFVNKWHEKWFDRHPKEIVGRNLRELFGEELYWRVEGYILSALAGNEVGFETTVTIGRFLLHLAVTLVPHKDDAGTVLGFYILAYDITDRVQVGAKLKNSEMQLAQAQHLAHLGSWEYDLQSNSFHWSEELYRICDLNPDKIRLSFKLILKLIHPDDLPLFKIAIETAYRSGNPFSLYHRIKRPNGTIRTIHSQGKVMADGEGTPLKIIGTAQDVTARKRAEETLKKKHLELKQFNRVLEKRVEEEVATNRQKDYLLIQQSRQAAMGEMIGNIAHQWRQPLTTVSLLIQNLNENYLYGDFNREFLDKTVGHAMEVIQYMSQTIDDFRNFFKPDRDKTLFPVSDVILKTISFLEPSMKYHNVLFDVQLADGLTMNGYANEFAQVLLNVMSNAKDAFLERGTAVPEIRIKSFRRKNKAVVTLQDNAGGIPEKIRERIFEPYFTTKELGNGTGVGLYMSKTIIEKHMGGRLTARNVGDGAEFRIEV